MKKYLIILMIAILALSLMACGNNVNNNDEASFDKIEDSSAGEGSKPEVIEKTEEKKENIQKSKLRPTATIELTDGRTIKFELYPGVAPNTVNNFIELAQSGFYDGVIFHRIIKDFMIQGGDPDGTGMGGPGYSIKAEFVMEKGNLTTFLSHKRGVVSMARSQMPDSAGSQFFIVHQDSKFLDQQYASFGVVVEGMDVVDALANVATETGDRPIEDVVMKTITIELNGYEPSAVEKIE